MHFDLSTQEIGCFFLFDKSGVSDIHFISSKSQEKQMTNLITREFNGKKIRQREDGYFSATDMCQASGKLVSGWLRLESTKEYLNIAARSMRIHADLLVQINNDGLNENRGTWTHRKISLRIAQWCSPEFSFTVDGWIEELLTKGYVIKSDVTSNQLKNLQAEIEQTKRRVSYLERSKEKITESVLGIYNIEQIMFRISKQLYPGKPNIFSKNGITYLGKKVIKELETEIGLKKTEMGWEHNIKNSENYVMAVVEAIALVFYNSGNDEQAERIIELFQIE